MQREVANTLMDVLTNAVRFGLELRPPTPKSNQGRGKKRGNVREEAHLHLHPLSASRCLHLPSDDEPYTGRLPHIASSLMMRMRHVASHQLSRLRRRYPFLRRVTATTTLITLVWIYTLYWGERSVFNTHIASCDWRKWEDWPKGATPHHMVLIADPQLVDPHTYPGRPWPLSTLTEMYTDAYMAHNFRLINQHLDPDSIVFLGDLFDGGREWAPEKAKSLKQNQRQYLDERFISADRGRNSWESYKASTSKRPAQAAWQTDYSVGEALKEFKPGEKGKWSRWGQEQWDKDLRRFASIFYAPEQLYPTSERSIFPAYELHDSVGVDNGADETPLLEYATAGAKPRQMITSLPGNHDLGFGALVQLSVRDRFITHFGDPNRIDIIGNHTFVSIDAPSLSAHSQYMTNGYESDNQQIQDAQHLWAESIDFLEDLRTPASKVVKESLGKYFPRHLKQPTLHHEVVDPVDTLQARSSEDQQPPIAKPKLPVVLLTHVPLFRPPDSECGKQREKGRAISISRGYQYQNVITQSLSKDIVTKVSGAGEIVRVFSGDDHDYCDVNHRYNLPPWPQSDGGKSILANIREITVKSFSWAMGVRKPGFQLVSLWNPVNAEGNGLRGQAPTMQTHMCLLPDQLSTFIDYALLLLYTVPVLFLRAVILALRSKDLPEAESEPSTPTTILPRFMPKLNGSSNDTANGYARHTDRFKERSGRHRASSTSTSSNAANNNNTLQVQRSYTARTRSVSPALGAAQNVPTPLIEKAGYFPAVRWHDPSDADESDEESHVGTEALSDVGDDDSQAKWKWRRRTPGKARQALGEFGGSLVVVGVPALLWYAVLVKNG